MKTTCSYKVDIALDLSLKHQIKQYTISWSNSIVTCVDGTIEYPTAKSHQKEHLGMEPGTSEVLSSNVNNPVTHDGTPY